jgi:O-antigen/teichoic acid export membrane protein
MTSIRQSLLFSFGQKYALAAMNLLTTVVLARLLTPSEIGVFMVGMALMSMTDALRDFGTGTYLIQAREITLAGMRTAFTVSLVLSAAVSVVLLTASGEIAAYYHEPGLRSVFAVMAVNFLIVPIVATIMALLRRDMAFDKIAHINLITAVSYFLVVNSLAAFGFSYMSLAWASLLSTGVSTLSAILHRPSLTIFRPAIGEWRKVVLFGGISTCTALLNVICWNLPQLALGRVLGLNAVGLYSRATMLCQIFDRVVLDGLSPVILPAFAERVRSGSELKTSYLRALEYITALHWPFLLCLALLASPVVGLLLGEHWRDVAPLVRIMAVASLSMFPAFLTYPVLVAVGRVRDSLTMSLVSMPPSAAILLGASFFGLHAVAASLLLTAPFQVFVALTFIRRQIHFSWRELVAATKNSAVVSLCTAAGPATTIAASGLRFDVSVVDMMIASVVAFLGWLAGLYITRHPLLLEIQGASAVIQARGSVRLASWRARKAPLGRDDLGASL